MSTSTLFVLKPLISSMITSRQVIMGLLDSTCISLRECYVATLWSLVLCGWMLDVDAVNLPLVSLLQKLVWPSRYWSSYYHPYFTYDLLWMIPSIILGIVMRLVANPWSGLLVPLDELLEFPLLNQFFNLLFQVTTFISVVAVILMKTIVLLRVTLPGGRT